MNRVEKAIIDALSEGGFKIEYSDDTGITIEPVFLKLKSIIIDTDTKWPSMTAKVYGITETGEKIPIYLSEGVERNHTNAHQDDTYS